LGRDEDWTSVDGTCGLDLISEEDNEGNDDNDSDDNDDLTISAPLILGFLPLDLPLPCNI